MSERIHALKAHIDMLNDAGVRRTTFFPIIAASLAQNKTDHVQIRRAKAFADLLDQAVQAVLPHELIAGSILGTWPLEQNPIDLSRQEQEAREAILCFRAEKTVSAGRPEGRTAIGFKKVVSRSPSRFALMARDHYDAAISFPDMQRLIRLMQDEFAFDADLEPYEIARVLEHHFEFDYGEEQMRLLDQLPWEAANHVDLNYGKGVSRGLADILQEIDSRMADADQEKICFYQTARIALTAVIRFIDRYAETLAQESLRAEPQRAAELKEMSGICRKIARDKPEHFREALQLVWLLHIVGNIAGGSALSFARFDQYMRPLYEKDLREKFLAREDAAQLLSCIWLKINEPKMRTVQSICLGGVRPDGSDGASDLTRCVLETIRELKLPYPNVSVRYALDISPAWLLDEAVQTIQAGFGHPMILNDQIWIPNLMKLGYPAEIARDYYNMGCVEIMIQGRQPNWIGSGGINFAQTVLDVLRQAAAGEIAASDFQSFQEFYLREMEQTLDQLRDHGLQRLADIQARMYDPFASVLIDDCLEKGYDVFQGGSLLPPHIAISGTGLGTAADSLAAIRQLVYDHAEMSLAQLNQVLEANYSGEEVLRTRLDQQMPKYGNDLDLPDQMAKMIFDHYSDRVFSYNQLDGEAHFVNVLFTYNSHVSSGEITGATPNGRLKGQPLSDCVGPSQGKDSQGPTSLLNSVLKLDFSKVTGAYALNVKLNPGWAQKDSGKMIVSGLIHAYLRDDGPQLQFNMQKVEDLKAAQADPEKHKDIVVRIAGYCEYFVNLDRQLQNEIISRTEHEYTR